MNTNNICFHGEIKKIIWIPLLSEAVMYGYFYQAYSYHGETLLASEKCGEAIRGLQEGIAGL